ncbi:Phage terminase, small subunit [Labilithrix luteola]|uniref:Phage terminase, small subunit n=1 Tax=Labilithrix luteola TaxID=1391654 RepID=A0A0K1PV98_9BACT|nr:terminase [Labilithrix luteola]AKU97458.1 Phage terminase, small subunit [Labilithrix luteola]
MTTTNLESSPWNAYRRVHRSRKNLLVHLLAVPVFIAGTALVVFGLVELSPWPVLGGVVAMALSMAVQGAGHATEACKVEPFSSPFGFVRRIFTEQLVTFPRYVLSGELARVWREAGDHRASA